MQYLGGHIKKVSRSERETRKKDYFIKAKIFEITLIFKKGKYYWCYDSLDGNYEKNTEYYKNYRG